MFLVNIPSSFKSTIARLVVTSLTLKLSANHEYFALRLSLISSYTFCINLLGNLEIVRFNLLGNHFCDHFLPHVHALLLLPLYVLHKATYIPS